MTEVKCPNVPGKPEFGEHTIPFSSTIYIERSDFKEHDVKVSQFFHSIHINQDYFGLALDNAEKYVKLKNANVNIKLVDAIKDEAGNITELVAEHCGGALANAKVHPVHWVPLVVRLLLG